MATHAMKLNFHYSESGLDCRKNFFSKSCIDVLNNKLTENEVGITSLNSFKKAVDKINLGVIVEGAPLMSKI